MALKNMSNKVQMNKFYITIMVLLIAGTLSAQLKNVTPSQGTKASSTDIEVPSVKKIGNVSTAASFSPQPINFQLNTQNGLKVLYRSENNRPLFISGTPEKVYRNIDTPEGMGFNFIENAKELLDIQNAEKEYKVVSVEKDELGMSHVKFAQMHLDVPVYGAEIIFHFDDRQQFLNGRSVSTPELMSVEPAIDESIAKERAVSDIGGITKIENDKYNLFDFERHTSELVIYNGVLAYHNTIYKNLVDRWEYMIDANTGEVIKKYESICKFHNHDTDATCNHNNKPENRIEEGVLAGSPPPDGPVVSNGTDLFGQIKQINTYEKSGKFYMLDAARTMFDGQNSSMPDDPVGTIWTIDAFDTSPQNSNFQYDHVSSNNQNFSGKETGVSAQFNGGKAYEYFKNVHGRESINGAGGNVIGLINIADEDGSSLGNAFWNGVAMFYGNGDNSFRPLARGLDVAGHEMSHGVVQSTANLEYQGESGALNESFADIFGAMIDRDDWLVGEDVVNTSAFPSGALRSLQDPHNGAPTGNFNQGWQPRTYSERFMGPQDNGGVHINSGIPNYAFYLFATTNGVGKERAEKVYYRALTRYLTKSSQFIDARLAVVKASEDLYGASVADAAKSAFDKVEVFNGNATTTQTDVEVNPGEDLILFTTEDQNNIYVADAAGNLIFNPLTEQDPLSVPSISDDGTEIIFVNQDKELYYIQLDWTNNSIVFEGVLTSNEQWRNAAFSRDGLRMAALRDVENNEIFVYDFVSETGNDYELFNPTFTEGVNTGDVLYADALKFDFSGEYIMYDAFNRIESSFGNPIDYWDIGFIKVFNTANGSFTLGDDVDKLFSQLPEGVSIGNPTFSKNSDYIIAFDYLKDGSFSVLGSNIETNQTGEIYTDNDRPGYPDYSRNDDVVIFDAASNGTGVIAAATLNSNKIESNDANVQLGFQGTAIKWGVWFSNGERDLTSIEDAEFTSFYEVYPNPTTENIRIRISEQLIDVSLSITDLVGREILKRNIPILKNNDIIDLSTLVTGTYVLSIISEGKVNSKLIIKE